MKIIQHLLSRIWEGLVHLSMSKVFPGYIIVVLNQDISVNIVNFFKLIPLIHPSRMLTAVLILVHILPGNLSIILTH
jgi:hypothetical protein